MAEPMNPVAPVTKTRMMKFSELHGGPHGRMIYPGKVVTLYGYNG
jgi:hypothetical protein